MSDLPKELHEKYALGYKIQHKLALSPTSEVCALCGYASIAHTSQAICDMCGLPDDCDFYPDFRSPSKLLLCRECLVKEVTIGISVKSQRQQELTAANITSPAQYLISSSPSLKSIESEVLSDPNIPDDEKQLQICLLIRARIENLQKNVFAHNEKARAGMREISESQVFLQEKQRQLDKEHQEKYHLLDTNYESPKPPKTVKVPKATTRMTKGKLEEITKWANTFGIPVEGLQIIMSTRKLDSPEKAAKVYLETIGKLA